MNVELFAILDTAAERYVDPFPAGTIEMAIRGFKEACETEGHQFNKFAEDYSLWHVGSFDVQLGVIETMAARKIAVATSYVHGSQIDIEDQIRSQA